MNWLDAVLIVPLIFGAWRGFKNGLLFEIVMVVILAAAAIGGYHLVDVIVKFVGSHFHYHSKWLPFFVFVGFLVALSIVLFLLRKSLNSLVSLIGMGLLNSLAGMIFGFIKLALIMSLILYFLTPFDTDNKVIPKNIKEHSLLYKPMTETVKLMIPEYSRLTKKE